MKNLYQSSILIIGTQKYIIVIWFPIVRGKKFKNQIIKKTSKMVQQLSKPNIIRYNYQNQVIFIVFYSKNPKNSPNKKE